MCKLLFFSLFGELTAFRLVAFFAEIHAQLYTQCNIVVAENGFLSTVHVFQQTNPVFTGMLYIGHLHLHKQQQLRQDNVFTGVCQSFCPPGRHPP